MTTFKTFIFLYSFSPFQFYVDLNLKKFANKKYKQNLFLVLAYFFWQFINKFEWNFGHFWVIFNWIKGLPIFLQISRTSKKVCNQQHYLPLAPSKFNLIITWHQNLLCGRLRSHFKSSLMNAILSLHSSTPPWSRAAADESCIGGGV